jgi:hypothetical protein
VGRGYSPIIGKDGIQYDYEEFKRAVESVRFGDDA